MPGRTALPTVGIESLSVNGQAATYLLLTFTHPDGLADASYLAEFSETLTLWTGGGVLVGSTHNSDGTITEVWRSPQPVSAHTQWFARVKVP